MRFKKKCLILVSLFLGAAQAFSHTTHLVQQGDTLSGIAKRYYPKQKVYGSQGAVHAIFYLNKNSIAHPDLIFVGQKIILTDEITIQKIIRSPTIEESSTEEKKRILQPQSAMTEQDSSATTKTTPSRHHQTTKVRSAQLMLGLDGFLWDRNLKDKTTGATGVVRSNASLGFNILADFPVSETWDIQSGISYQNIEFANSTNRTLDAKSKSFLSLMLGFKKERLKFSYQFGLRYEQIPLITGVSVSAVGVSSFSLLSPYFGGTLEIHEWQKTIIGASLLGHYHLPSNNDDYKLENGWSLSLGLPISRDLSEVSKLQLKPYIQYGLRNTNTVEHQDLIIGTQFNWLWMF